MTFASFLQTFRSIAASVALPVFGLTFTFAAGACAELTQQQKPELLDQTEIIALLPEDADIEAFKTAAAALGFVLREDTALTSLGERMIRFTIPDRLDGPGAIAELEALAPNTTAGVNHAYAPASTDLSAFDYANDIMEWPASACAAQGPIGIIDTSVDPAMATALGGRLIAQDFVRGTATSTQHGSDVASILLDPRRLSGATLYSAGVIGRQENGRNLTGVDSILKGLDWLNEEGVKLVNMSLVGPYNKILDRGVQQATRDGMVIVAAVGNDGAATPARYPAALESVIGVTAVDAAGDIYRNAVQGQYVDLAAPGVDIPISGSGGPRFVTGTSMAAPFVAVMIAANSDLYGQSAANVRTTIAANARDLGVPGRDTVFGAGLIRANAACGQ